MIGADLKTSRAWRIKETFKQFWYYHFTGAAKRFFDAWSGNAMRSRLKPIKKVVKMLRRYEAGLLNYSTHRISNACAEGFNSAIQLIKANARWFRNFTNYRARILFHCGKLNLSLGSLSSNSKCNTSRPDGLRCCHANKILSTHEC